MRKHEWRKTENSIYLPNNKPEIIDIPEYIFLTIEGEGNPGSSFFSDCIGVLYQMSYAIKMNLKKFAIKPEGYYDYTVYPLEGVWDINQKARINFNGTINKDDLVFKLMIRQPDFLDDKLFKNMLQLTQEKKPDQLLSNVRFQIIHEGLCVQMLHIGSYDNEAETFKVMEDFTAKKDLLRVSKVHREIYLSDFRKTAIDKLKTVLRFQVTHYK